MSPLSSSHLQGLAEPPGAWEGGRTCTPGAGGADQAVGLLQRLLVCPHLPTDQGEALMPSCPSTRILTWSSAEGSLVTPFPSLCGPFPGDPQPAAAPRCPRASPCSPLQLPDGRGQGQPGHGSGNTPPVSPWWDCLAAGVSGMGASAPKGCGAGGRILSEDHILQ